MARNGPQKRREELAETLVILADSLHSGTPRASKEEFGKLCMRLKAQDFLVDPSHRYACVIRRRQGFKPRMIGEDGREIVMQRAFAMLCCIFLERRGEKNDLIPAPKAR